MNTGKNGMVKFYQSWCGHCKRMKPDWDRLAEETNNVSLIADVDCGAQQDVSCIVRLFCIISLFVILSKYIFLMYRLHYDCNCNVIPPFIQLCDEVGVEGYPTIKYYVDGKEHDYNGGRSFEELSAFVGEKIVPMCTFKNEAKSCSERSLKYIEKWSIKTLDQRKAESKRLENLLFEEMKLDLKQWVRERLGILKTSLDEKEL